MPEKININDLFCPFLSDGKSNVKCLGIQCALAVPFVLPEGETFARCSIFIIATMPMNQPGGGLVKPATISRLH